MRVDHHMMPDCDSGPAGSQRFLGLEAESRCRMRRPCGDSGSRCNKADWMKGRFPLLALSLSNRPARHGGRYAHCAGTETTQHPARKPNPQGRTNIE